MEVGLVTSKSKTGAAGHLSPHSSRRPPSAEQSDMRLACCIALLLPLLHGKATGKTTGKAKGRGRPSAMQRCTTYVNWARRVGIKDHPERFPGLTASATEAQVQHQLHLTMPSSRCPDASGSFSAPALPLFTTRLGLNSTQLKAYRGMRKRHAAELSSKAFKQSSNTERTRRRHEIAMATLREMHTLLNATQLSIFRNRTASPRRPPAMHVAATLWSSSKHSTDSRH